MPPPPPKKKYCLELLRELSPPFISSARRLLGVPSRESEGTSSAEIPPSSWDIWIYYLGLRELFKLFGKLQKRIAWNFRESRRQISNSNQQ
jgi:hypothetical protein